MSKSKLELVTEAIEKSWSMIKFGNHGGKSGSITIKITPVISAGVDNWLSDGHDRQHVQVTIQAPHMTNGKPAKGTPQLLSKAVFEDDQEAFKGIAALMNSLGYDHAS